MKDGVQVCYGVKDIARFSSMRGSCLSHHASALMRFPLEREAVNCLCTWYARVRTEANVSDYPHLGMLHTIYFQTLSMNQQQLWCGLRFGWAFCNVVMLVDMEMPDSTAPVENKRVRWPTCRARQQHFSWRGWNNETTRVTRLDNSHQNMLRQSSYHGFFDTSFWSNVYPQKINCNNNSELGRLEQCWWMIWKHCRLIS